MARKRLSLLVIRGNYTDGEKQKIEDNNTNTSITHGNTKKQPKSFHFILKVKSTFTLCINFFRFYFYGKSFTFFSVSPSLTRHLKRFTCQLQCQTDAQMIQVPSIQKWIDNKIREVIKLKTEFDQFASCNKAMNHFTRRLRENVLQTKIEWIALLEPSNFHSTWASVIKF